HVTGVQTCALPICLRVAELDGRAEEGHVPDALGVGGQIPARSADELLLERLDLAGQLFLLLEQLLHAIRELAAPRLHERARLSELPLEVANVRERAGASLRLDAANARRDSAFAHDLERADVAGARRVGAAAQ